MSESSIYEYLGGVPIQYFGNDPIVPRSSYYKQKKTKTYYVTFLRKFHPKPFWLFNQKCYGVWGTMGNHNRGYLAPVVGAPKIRSFQTLSLVKCGSLNHHSLFVLYFLKILSILKNFNIGDWVWPNINAQGQTLKQPYDPLSTVWSFILREHWG